MVLQYLLYRERHVPAKRHRHATIIGFGGMAGGIGSSLINMGSGVLFDYAANTQLAFMGFTGKPAGYFIIFCICSVAYLIGWIIMKALVPEYKPPSNHKKLF